MMAPRPVRVSQLNGYIKRVLQADPVLGHVAVIGEISNFKHHSSGHVYFSLKDAQSKINCFLPSDIFRRCRFELGDGMEIIAEGYVSVYERGGYYSLSIREISVKGTGNLAEAFERLKQKLASEGLFDPARKKTLPVFPKTIAIVTSPTGAAIEDMLKIIRSKNDCVRILIYPTLVQGPDAAAQIAAGIDYINAFRPETDIIITGRGGGSAEELWAFNEEILARRIAASTIPVISAVGHETDVTIADFVADLRAETPTAAAGIAVPDTRRLRADLVTLQNGMDMALKRRIQTARQRLSASNEKRFKAVFGQRAFNERARADRMRDRLSREIRAMITEQRNRVRSGWDVIEALSPKNIMGRGYAALTDMDGRLIDSAEALNTGDHIQAVLKDGRAKLLVEEVI